MPVLRRSSSHWKRVTWSRVLGRWSSLVDMVKEQGATAHGALRATLTVYALTTHVPEWAVPFDSVANSLVSLDVAETSNSVVLMDASIINECDPAWLASVEESMGPVVAVCAVRSEAHRAQHYGARAAVPESLLGVSVDVAQHVLSDLLAAPPESKEKLERYMRDAIHEFRTPLTIISEFTALCEDGVGGPLTERQETYLGYIQAAVDRMSEHFDDFRDGVRMRLGSLQHASSTAALSDVVGRAVDSKQARLLAGGAAGSVKLDRIDEARLEEAVHRLIGGAQKLSSSAEVVGVSTRLAAPGKAEICVRYRGVVLSSADIGVMEEGTVMQPDGFYRSVARVFGLGVSMARLFLAQSAGSLRLEIEEGMGGAFIATVPIQKVAAPSLEAPEIRAGAA